MLVASYSRWHILVTGKSCEIWRPFRYFRSFRNFISVTVAMLLKGLSTLRTIQWFMHTISRLETSGNLMIKRLSAFSLTNGLQLVDEIEHDLLIHWDRVTHICVSILTTWPSPSHCLNQCRDIVNWTLRNKLQWNPNRKSYIFIQGNALENVVSKIAAILSPPQCVNAYRVIAFQLCSWRCYDYEKRWTNHVSAHS